MATRTVAMTATVTVTAPAPMTSAVAMSPGSPDVTTGVSKPTVLVYIEPPANECLNQDVGFNSNDTWELRAPGAKGADGPVLAVANDAWGREHNCAIGVQFTLDPVPNPPIVDVFDPKEPQAFWGPFDLRDHISGPQEWTLNLALR